MSASQTGKERLILWFRNDLRMHDNEALYEAAQRVKKGQASEVLPLYCYDPRHFGTTPWGNKKTGDFRAKFLIESVNDLKQRLQQIGSDLLVMAGKPEEVIPSLLTAEEGDHTTVMVQCEVTSEELAVEKAVEKAISKAGASLELHWGATLYHLDDLPFAKNLSNLPVIFTPFKQKVESQSEIRKLLPPPKQGELPLPAGVDLAAKAFTAAKPEDLNSVTPEGAQPLATAPLHPKAVLDFKGGETAALARLQYYLWDTDAVAVYFETRNNMLGGDFSTKFSPWLAHGCLSPRKVYFEMKKYEAERTQNKSTYWVVFELEWRDFFRFFAIKHGNKMFHEAGITGEAQEWAGGDEAFQRWRDGRTGRPLVDANMRELAATGYMSNRGRQNVASFLILDLRVDWRRGADWFETCLSDYDVCSNWGNWVTAAGLAGGRINKFNIIKQSKEYDPTGDYIRTWVPELAALPAHHIHEPWLMPRDAQDETGVVIGHTYPNPLPTAASSGPSQRQKSRGGRGGRGGRGHRDGGRRNHGGGRGGGNRRGRQSDFEQYG